MIRQRVPVRAKLLPQVSASLTANRQNTDFGGGFPASYGNSPTFAIRGLGWFQVIDFK